MQLGAPPDTQLAVGAAEVVLHGLRFLSGRGDHRVDVYALGCVLHETLTGQRPFDGEGPAAQMYAHVNLPPPQPTAARPQLPPAFDTVVARAMTKDPEQRFASAGDLARSAQAALVPAHRPTLVDRPNLESPVGHATGRPRWQVGLAATAAALLLLGAGTGIGIGIGMGLADSAGDTTAAGPQLPSKSSPTAPATGPGAVPTSSATEAAGQVGQTLSNGGITLTITNATRAESIEMNESGYRPGSGFESYTATPAGDSAAFVIVSTHIVNDGRASLDLTCGYPVETKLVDDRNRRFDAIQELYKLRNNPECNSLLQPGFESDMIYVYRIPATAVITEWSFLDLSENLGNTSPPTTVRLDLQPA